MQVYHGTSGNRWDAHQGLKKSYNGLCRNVDKPIVGLLRDLKQRGLLDETLVVWATEFARTPGAEGASGRDHHPYAFSTWMAGGGVKGGHVHGATDAHATVLHLLGIAPRRMAVPGRKRLEMDFGHPITDIIA